jgi:hypothetical protein
MAVVDTVTAVAVVDTAAAHKAQNRTSRLLASLSCLLIIVMLFTPQFDYSLPFSSFWTSINVVVMMLAGAVFVRLFYPLNFQYSIRIIILMGILLRLLFIVGPPVLEDDMYRYFFDGSLATHSMNPFEHRPADAYTSIEKGIEKDRVIEANDALAYLHKIDHFKRVAYPSLTTIYPLTAQAFFALSALIEEFNLTAWRFLLFLVELSTLFLLYQLLLILKQPPAWVMAYWLNPIVITEGINAAHMDVLLVPFLLMAFLALYHSRIKSSAVCLGLAVGVKIWPLLLAPLFLIHVIKQAGLKKSLVFLIICSLTCALVLLPLFLALTPHAGVVNYSQQWHVNSFLFSILNSTLVAIDKLFDESYVSMRFLARMIVAGGVCFFILSCGYRLLLQTKENEMALFYSTLRYSFWAALILFLLSPTGYPWYAFWFLPLFVLTADERSKPIVVFSFTLPLYDLRYIVQKIDYADYWQWLLVTCTFLPIIVLLFATQLPYFRKIDAKIQP